MYKLKAEISLHVKKFQTNNIDTTMRLARDFNNSNYRKNGKHKPRTYRKCLNGGKSKGKW